MNPATEYELQTEYETILRRRRERHGAAPASAEALMYALRSRGSAALADQVCRDRLAELSSTQLSEVIGRLMTLRPRYPEITDDLLLLLGDQL